MKRALLVLPIAALLGSLAACGSNDDAVRTGDRDRSTTTAAAGTPSEGDAVPADQVVWQEVTGGGYVPLEAIATEVPSVTIYGDGRILATVEDPDHGYAKPVALEQNQISPKDLEAFLAEAQESGLFEPDHDFGSPQITDNPTTTVTLRAGDAPQTVSVYALGYDDPASEGKPFGMTDQQQASRAELRDLLAKARALGDGGEEYVPDRVRATMLDGTITDPDGPAPTPWPGPAFAEFPPTTPTDTLACLVIEGDQAREVYATAVTMEGTRWSEGDDVRSIIIAPVLPGQEGCPPA